MKELLLKATFDNNITLLIFKKKNNMLQYETIRSLSKQSTSSFNPTKDMPDSYLEIPEKSRNEVNIDINDTISNLIIKREKQKQEFNNYFSDLLQNNLKIFSPETTLKLIEITIF